MFKFLNRITNKITLDLWDQADIILEVILKLTILILLIVLSFATANAGLSSSPELPDEMSFISGSHLKKPNAQGTYRFNEIARVANLPIIMHPVSAGYDVGFHFAATLPKFEKTILFAFGRKLNPRFTEKIYKVETGHFYQLKFDESQASLLFTGFNELEVKDVISKYNRVYQTSSPSLKDQRIPASSDLAKNNTEDREIIGNDSANESNYSYAVGESFKQCGIGTVQGANSTAKAILVDPVVTLWNTVFHTKKVWANTVAEWETLKNNLIHFEAFTQKVFQDFKSLPEAEKSRLYCSFVGAGGAGGLALKGTNAAVSMGVLAKVKPPTTPKIEPIGKSAEAGVKTFDQRLAAFKEKMGSKANDSQIGLANYVLRFYPEFPDDALSLIVQNLKSATYSGNELTLHYPFPGAQAVTFYFGREGRPSTMSVFLGWGPSNPARNNMIASGKRLGLAENISEHFQDGFLGTNDPQKIIAFLKKQYPTD